LPAPDEAMKAATPAVTDAAYAQSMLGFVGANVPEHFEGLPVHFASTFIGLITPAMAGTSDGTQLGLVNLEVWGAPISQPMIDPANNNFVFQRFQRGVMHFDATTGVTRGLLLADYLKAVLIGRDLPSDLRQQAEGGWLYGQYCPDRPRALCRPDELPGTDLTAAFEPQ
jgi:hypothetical protein